MKWIVSFEVDAPDDMQPGEITAAVGDALLDMYERNREDPTHTEFDISDPEIEPA